MKPTTPKQIELAKRIQHLKRLGYSYRQMANACDLSYGQIFCRATAYTKCKDDECDKLIEALERMQFILLSNLVIATPITIKLMDAIVKGYTIRKIAELIDCSHEFVRNLISSVDTYYMRRETFDRISANLYKLSELSDTENVNPLQNKFRIKMENLQL
jgi:DNA-binding transcriptional MerR regulator